MNWYADVTCWYNDRRAFAMQTKYHSSPRDEAEEKIECYILEHALGPHDRLPSERDLCNLWEMNRSTLHSAIARLIRIGRLYSQKGSGTYVAEPKVTRNLQDLKSFSKVMEEHERDLETRVLSLRAIESSKTIARQLHLLLGHKVFELIRIRMTEGGPIALETSYVDVQRCPNLDIHDFSKESLYYVFEKEYHIEIAKGEERITVTYSTAEDSKLLGIPIGQALFSLSGVISDTAGIPVEYVETLVRPDYIRFASQLIRKA